MNKSNRIRTVCGSVSEEEKVYLAKAYDSHYNTNNSNEKVLNEYGRIRFVPTDKRKKETSHKKKNGSHSKNAKKDQFREIDYTFPIDEQEEYYPHFFRLSNGTKPQFLLRLLLEAWRIKVPKAVISIIGTDGHFSETEKYSLKRQLLKTVKSTGAWIITDGKDEGVSQFVGQAVHEYRVKNGRRDIVTIGFAPWDKTIKCEEKCIFKEKIKKLLPFEPNHSHFILIDSEEKVKKVRLEFEEHISKIGKSKIYEYEKGIPEKQIKRGKDQLEMVKITETEKKKSLKIPVVMVVIGGEPDIMIDIKTSLENKIPVVVIQNSGGVADFIASCRSTERTRLKHNILTNSLKASVEKFCADSTSKKTAEEQFMEVKEVLRLKEDLHVYKLGEETTTLYKYIQDIMFQTLQAAEIHYKDQIEIVNMWNRGDIIQEIFEFAPPEELQIDETYIWHSFKSAILENKVELTAMLVKYIVNMDGFLRYNLQNLYEETMKTKENEAGRLLSKSLEGGKEEKFLKRIGSFVENLLGDKTLNPYPTCPNESSFAETPLVGGNFSHLLLMSVLTNRKEMADFFWKQDTNVILSALYVSSLSNKLSKLALSNEDVELYLSFEEISKDFEFKASNVMAELYKLNVGLSHKHLVTRDLWNNVTSEKNSDRQQESPTDLRIVSDQQKTDISSPIALAERYDLMTFMATNACQTKLTSIWKGQIARYTPTWKIVIGVFFPFVVIPRLNLIKIIEPKDESDAENRTNDTKKRTYLKYVEHEGKRITRKPVSDHQQNNGNVKNKHENDNAAEVKSFLTAIVLFYHAPISKFVIYVITYIIFLVIFSYFILTDLHDMHTGGPSWLEWVTWIWSFIMIINEIREIGVRDYLSWRDKFRNWISDSWNHFDIIMLLLFTISVFLRLLLPPYAFAYARVAYSITLTMYILRMMQFFYVTEKIGPKVIMLGRMMKDILFFVLIFALFLFSFGIIYQSTLFPNADPNWQGFVNIIYKPYWQLFGELFLEQIRGEEPSECSNNPILYKNGTLERCPERNSTNSLMLGIYMLIANIVLVNMLIAMFTNTFEKVQRNSHMVWKFHRYSLVHEFYSKPITVGPFVIIYYIYEVILAVRRRYTKSNTSQSEQLGGFVLKLTDEQERERIMLHERDALDSFLQKRYLANRTEEDIEDQEELGHVSLLEAIDNLKKSHNELVEELDKKKKSVMVLEVPGRSGRNFLVND